jgi:hypothetical protein
MEGPYPLTQQKISPTLEENMEDEKRRLRIQVFNARKKRLGSFILPVSEAKVSHELPVLSGNRSWIPVCADLVTLRFIIAQPRRVTW